MSKRKSISKRTRFEIFKRDSFTCQYCGKKPPLVILHVDHIVPCCDGGGFENENLATACSDCNLGKAGVPLLLLAESIKEKLQFERERMKQMAEYNSWLREVHAAREKDFMEISAALISAQGDDPNELIIAGTWASSVRLMLKKLPVFELVNAVEIANDRIGFKSNAYKAWKYFCGVCWRKADSNDGRVR